jgi:sugar phosphate isomerase/epimerase
MRFQACGRYRQEKNMKTSFNRREFLAGSGRLAAGLAAASMARTAPAEEGKQDICLACRDVHLNQTGRKDCWPALDAIGAEGVEASLGEDLSLPGLSRPDRQYSAATAVGIETLRADMKGAGKRISALCMNNRFEDRPDFEADWCARAARAAQALGAKAIRIDVVPHKLPAAEFLDFSVRTLKQILAVTEPTGVAFAIENHGGTTNNPEFLKPLFDRVGSPRLGLTLDTGNFYWFGHPLSKVHELYEAFAARVRHTHCKSIRFPEAERERRRPVGWEYGKYNCPIYDGDIDFRRVVKILRAASYTGDLCVEDESLDKFPAGERGAILAKEIHHLRDCL